MTAFRFLLPMTAPAPQRPATRSPLAAQAKRTPFSPAGPMTSLPYRSGSSSWVRSVSRPWSWGQASMRILPSSTTTMLSSGAFPHRMSPSKPAFFSSIPKGPPQLEEAIPPVRTFLKVMLNRLELGAPVSFMGPVLTISTASGLRGSSPAVVRSVSSRAPRALPPRYCSNSLAEMVHFRHRPFVRSTWA